jgi:hypothetical protein
MVEELRITSQLVPNRVLILFRTASSIFTGSGPTHLKPSPGSFFVAAMPSLLPMGISPVA